MQAHHAIEVLSKEHGWEVEDGTAASRFAAHCRRVAREYASRQVEVATIHGPRLRVLKGLQQICAEGGGCVVTQKVCARPSLPVVCPSPQCVLCVEVLLGANVARPRLCT